MNDGNARDDANRIAAEIRDRFGKGAARKLRAVGKIPAVIYGHGENPQHISLPAHETGLVLRKANAVISLDLEGAEQITLVKDVQKDPVRQIIEHVDLIAVRQGEKVSVDVPVHLDGEPISGTLATLDVSVLTVEADAMSIPENLTISVAGLGDGTHILARDVTLPQGTTLLDDPDLLVVSVAALSSRADASDGVDGAAGDATA